MTICLTGDVHHLSMETRDQAHLDRTEVDAALEYARIARSYDLSATLFLTGRCGVEEPDRCRQLGEQHGIEIGGHNYYAFRAPVLGRKPYGLCRKLFGVDAPAFVQRWEVRRTRRVLGALSGEPVTSWRDHGYRHDSNTTTVLREQGITHFSDDVTPERTDVYEKDGLVCAPINVLPDHEHLYHGDRTPEYVAQLEWSNAFTDRSYEPDDWLDRVLDGIERIRQDGGTATVLAHPACMDIVDGFDVFERLCSHLSEYETRQMRDVSPSRQ